MVFSPGNTVAAPTRNSHHDLTDRRMGEQVIQALWGSNMPGLRRIAIEVRRGTVTLRGEVASFYERQTAVARTVSIKGVSRVVDMLRVRGQ
jgi:osmotically-inducible protein OsmY